MNNMFSSAYFGKAYKTRNGSKAIFICERTNNAVWDLNHPYACVIEGYGEIWNYFPNGRLYIGENFETENDIVSEWQEEINEEELAEEYIQGFDCAMKISPNLLSLKKDKAIAKSAFKAGYRKAMEE